MSGQPMNTEADRRLAAMLPHETFLAEEVADLDTDGVEAVIVNPPDGQFGFLHEAAVVEFNGTLYAAWYNCPATELQGYTPICGRRSKDGGRTWSERTVICDDPSGKLLYCPPVFGIDGGRLYLFVNRMVAPDHIHSLDLYVLDPASDRFERLWSKPVPFKLNTNAVRLPDGRRMLPGRVGELDGFPNTPAVLLSDDGRLDDDWRQVKIMENGDLPDGSALVHPEISVIENGGTLRMFCRNDARQVPLVFRSDDLGETWSGPIAHDIPIIASKIYCGTLSDGRHYLIANIDKRDRSRLAVYFSEKGSLTFSRRMILFDGCLPGYGPKTTACHYPAAYEANGKLYVIATLNYETSVRRGAVLFTVDPGSPDL
ncbi:MAG: exo-alpha-sialidase [Clostridia bacterium]|nr:exo-alpha-sialidase [Clostridia bacterium]